MDLCGVCGKTAATMNNSNKSAECLQKCLGRKRKIKLLKNSENAREIFPRKRKPLKVEICGFTLTSFHRNLIHYSDYTASHLVLQWHVGSIGESDNRLQARRCWSALNDCSGAIVAFGIRILYDFVRHLVRLLICEREHSCKANNQQATAIAYMCVI